MFNVFAHTMLSTFLILSMQHFEHWSESFPNKVTKLSETLRCQGIGGVLLGSGIVALVSLVEGACALVLLLLYACAPGWPQLFLCIIDGKVRIAEVMR